MRRLLWLVLGLLMMVGCVRASPTPIATLGQDGEVAVFAPRTRVPATATRMPTSPPPCTPTDRVTPAATASLVWRVATAPALYPTGVPDITLTILYDNNPGDGGLRADWGFACLVEGLAETILFDTGSDGALLLHNMGALGVAVDEIDAIVLSHAHTDHTGGLAAMLAEVPGVTIYLLPSFPEELKRHVREADAVLVEVQAAMELCPGAWVTGRVGTLIPEQALVVRGSEGLTVLTGCAHPGIVEMVRAAQRRVTLQEESGVPWRSFAGLDLVLGGFHLSDMSVAEIDGILAELRDLGVQRVAPCHCSGDWARQRFEMAYEGSYVPVGVGTRLTLD